MGLLTVGVGLSLTLLPAFGMLSSYCVALSSLNRRGGAKLYCNLIYHDWLTYIGGQPFSEEKERGIDGQRVGGKTGMRGGRGNCDRVEKKINE